MQEPVQMSQKGGFEASDGTDYSLERSALLFGNFFQRVAYSEIIFRPSTTLTSPWSLLLFFPLLRGQQLATTKRRPRYNSHALVLAHRYDLGFHISVCSVPSTLVYREWCQAVPPGDCWSVWASQECGDSARLSHSFALTTTQAGVSDMPRYNTCLAMTYVCRCIMTSSTDVAKSHLWALVTDLVFGGRTHYLPMHIENVNIVGLQLFQTVSDR